MAEKEPADEDVIHGLSVVDDTLHVEETGRPEDDALVVKIDDEADIVVEHDACEEVEESFLEEAEEKINLRDVLIEKNTERESKDTCHNSTLIITTEEHLDKTTFEDTMSESVADENKSINATATAEDSKKTSTKMKPKSEDHCHFWVSNISHHVKATDLKKLFTPTGRVLTAKILTNGKNNFGYVSMESEEIVEKCIRHLNNISFDGKRIIVSKDRPDLRETKQVKLESRRKKAESQRETKAVESKLTEAKKVKLSDDEDENNDPTVELKNKLETLKTEVSRYKWKIIEYQRRHDGMRKKCCSLEKELKGMEFKMRNDRRRLNQDRDQFEKSKKIDLSRIEADKIALNKELAEVSKLREQLKTKIEEFKLQPKKNLKRRPTRTPPPIDRSRRSPPLRAGPRTGYRPDERMEKKRKREDAFRGRTPPPPPKLSNGTGKKRNENLPHRQFFEDLGKRVLPLDHGYEYRHKTSFAPPQEVSRPPWSTPYSKDPRRMGATSSGGQSYPGDSLRFGGGYQFPSSSITVTPRSYYPEFSKPYGHY